MPHGMRARAGDTVVHFVDETLGRLVGKAGDRLLVELIENDDMVSFHVDSAWRADSAELARQMLESHVQELEVGTPPPLAATPTAAASVASRQVATAQDGSGV